MLSNTFLILNSEFLIKKGRTLSLDTVLPFFQRGDGGGRTLVQTRNQYAFYMLIPAFGFRASARPGPPTNTLV